MRPTVVGYTLTGERPFSSRAFRHGFERAEEIVDVSTRLGHRIDGPIIVVSADELERRAIELAASVTGAAIEVGSPSSLEGRDFGLVALVLPAEVGQVRSLSSAVSVVPASLRAVAKSAGVVVDFYDLHADSWWGYFERSKAFRAALEGDR